MTVPCIACGTPFERKKRGPIAHHCPDCRQARNRNLTRERMQEMRTAYYEVCSRLPEEVALTASLDSEEMAYVLGWGKKAVVADMQPAGTKTPRGSEDGTSTWFTDLAGELETRARIAANDPWWAAHPHWCFGL